MNEHINKESFVWTVGFNAEGRWREILRDGNGNIVAELEQVSRSSGSMLEGTDLEWARDRDIVIFQDTLGDMDVPWYVLDKCPRMQGKMLLFRVRQTGGHRFVAEEFAGC